MNEKTEHTDLFGREIKVGNYIVYAGAEDRSAVLRVGQVLKLTFAKNRRYGEPDVAKVFCKSWNNFRSEGFSWREGLEPSGRQKNVTIGFLTRVVIVDPSTISDKIKKDLDGPICDWSGKPIGQKEDDDE